jgi:hypothetical protein
VELSLVIAYWCGRHRMGGSGAGEEPRSVCSCRV